MEVAVTVVMVTWNSADHVDDALTSLQSGLTGLSWRLVVADNASSDDTIERVRRRVPGATVVQTGYNAGYSAGINAALAVAGASAAYLVLNPDVIVGPGAIAALSNELSRPGVGIAVPLIRDERGQVSPSLRRDPTVLRAMGEALLGGYRAGRLPRLGELVIDPDAYRHATNVDWASGAVMLISHACAQRVGPWDESFLLYSEETDFALRARDSGILIRFCPDAAVTHIGGDAHVSSALYRLLVHNRVRLFRKRHGRARSVGFWMAVTLNELLRSHRRVNRAALRALMRPLTQPVVPGLGQR
ncbi:glycosyltransferase family 2 protein [Kribbia dieselivorans]|uniref:glycosyltransferase family 2 protein n=1 Tax=Kribbia dieselivorans TaxID=331526 RepID=UPI000838E42F|nr:glycosyltransferase family 2 protein [Kribbia dieselivorans]